jgi:hypothetical protein
VHASSRHGRAACLGRQHKPASLLPLTLVLRCAVLCCAVLCCAVLCCAHTAPPQVYEVLNEIVVDRGSNSFLTNIEAYIGGRFITRVQVRGRVCIHHRQLWWGGS